jgi:dethiobiotin synthetase
VGKTLFTGLLLAHLRRAGVAASAMKPLSSGGRGDVEFLQALQPGVLADDVAGPFWFDAPVAPLVAAREAGRRVSKPEVARAIRRAARGSDVLLVEGAGGLATPLGEGFDLRDVLSGFGGGTPVVVVVAPNRLGVLNHVLLIRQALQRGRARAGRVVVVLMGCRKPDASALSNASVLRTLCPGWLVIAWPFLGRAVRGRRGVLEAAKKMKKSLAQIVAFAKLPVRSSTTQ